MQAKLSHLLHPLTELTSNKVTFKCTDTERKYFDEIKRIVARNTLLIYTDLNTHFYIHTDASDFHMGAVINQDVKPIAFYRCKLTGPQAQYTVMEKELLSIVKTLKECCKIFLGQQLKYTKNIKI